MSTKKVFIAALTATSVLAAGAAFAADQATSQTSSQQTTQQQKTLNNDFGKLSADGSRAYGDVALTRLAIFDGRVSDAKKFAAEADTDFNKAKTDSTVFTKAESQFKTPDQKGSDQMASAKAGDAANQTNANQPGKDPSNKDASMQKQASNDGNTADMTKPKAWLPVDGEMTVNEDFSANPSKLNAVKDANQKLAKGDKKGAMESLKLADVNIDYIVAVVPLNQTLKDVHQAAGLVNDGKYYEASQMLRQVQDNTRYDLLDVNGVPKTGTQAPANGTVTH